MRALVVPTIREHNIQNFIATWREWGADDWDKIVVVEDNPEKTFTLPSDVIHLCWKNIDFNLKKDSWIISRRDSAIRCLGFLHAYRHLHADYIFTLDDDCNPTSSAGFCKQHLWNLNNSPKCVSSIPGMRLRGMPYKNIGKLEKVMFSIGLWSNVPDLDGVHSLVSPIENFEPELNTRIIPHGQYFPFCGMNFAFKRQAMPLAYFPLMGEGYPYGRFDDIWFGVIAKKVCDHLGWHISCGEPIIEHTRASNPFACLRKEAPGMEPNEHFWDIIDGIDLRPNISAAVCMDEIGMQLKDGDHSEFGDEFNEYLKKLGSALMIWSSLFDETA